jgi:hypothetical protein
MFQTEIATESSSQMSGNLERDTQVDGNRSSAQQTCLEQQGVHKLLGSFRRTMYIGLRWNQSRKESLGELLFYRNAEFLVSFVCQSIDPAPARGSYYQIILDLSCRY